MSEGKAVVIVFKSDGMGLTAPENQALRTKTAGNFLTLVNEQGMRPSAICFYTDGVWLTVEGSPLLAELKALEDQGVRLIICRTCLEFFCLTDRVRVGIVGGMGDIVTAMWAADSVIMI